MAIRTRSGAVLGGAIGKFTGNTAVGVILGTTVGGVVARIIGNRTGSTGPCSQ
ncbi:glycine zipper domain-containing protein [Bacteroidetes bacterium endosymbiont of Geopemphigus sp.]|uniref:glycine zipper domain-containing protein n=1 Tax=Bacteroidetes bacterium endosymbiont of Geopemphigus sp. TaxID=2047937 RepID=UPI0018A82702|nr:glycine zipper domain-containing protein [Bacteroidetes bacterium endosymbiont of Geopemphigus sp.]